MRLLLIFLALFFGIGLAQAQEGQAQPIDPHSLTRDAILNDPQAPVVGNPKGDVTIVAFEDYNCPYCKKSDPALLKLVKDDGHIRLVYKDWPILAETSIFGADLAIAAKYQDKYEAAHSALMRIPGAPKTSADKAAMEKAVKEAGIDMGRLQQDLDKHLIDIGELIQRNDAQAKGMGLQGTPVFLIGPYLVAAPLDYKGFKKVVAQVRKDAREAQKH